MAFQIRSWHLTDVGCVRDHNEDSGFADPQGRFFICSDGMGGHASGDVASAMAVQEISTRLSAWPAELGRATESQDGDSARLALAVIEQAVRAANEAIHRRGRAERDKHGMGCTCDVVAITGSLALCAHVGDSRQYLIRDGQTRQLTQDHSLSPPRMPGQPAQKGMLTSALGPNPTCRIDTFAIELRDGDRILMCTDGLADYFGDERELGATVAQRGEHPGAAWLVEQAKARGGADNITIVLIKIEKAPEVYAAVPVSSAPIVPPQRQDVVAVSYAAQGGTSAASSPKPVAPKATNTMPLALDITAPGARLPAAKKSADPAPAPPIIPPGTRAPRGIDRSDADEVTLPDALANKLGVFTTSPLFNGVAAQQIKKLISCGGEPRSLAAGMRVPRVWNGVDTAWLVLDGEFRGLLFYPEALVAPQGEWPGNDSPESELQAIPISRTDFARVCASEPDAGVKLLTNVARLIATDLKDLRKREQDTDVDRD